jgi:hypothetical protein
MSDLSYHLESENRNSKNYLAICCISASKRKFSKEGLLSLASASGEKSAWELLFKEQIRITPQPPFERMLVSADRSFEVLKLLGTTGRVFYQGKKIVIDPFSSFEAYFEAERQSPDRAQFCGRWALSGKTGSLQECDWVFSADPSWILKEGIIRPVREEVAGQWVKQAAAAAFSLQGPPLVQFLEGVDGEIRVDWKTEQASIVIDPSPFLVLADRHGGFADLWFDYGAFGKIAAHEDASSSFRNRSAEKGWEKDLMETDFIKKTVEQSHFYCPLDKVAKSLTFLLEIGWGVIDARGRTVLRQRQVDFDADIAAEKITVRAKVRYDQHEVDLKDLVGAFNRREHFVELSARAVALIDRYELSEQFGDLMEQEVTSEGISLKKNRFGILQGLLDQERLPIKEEIRQKIARLTRCEPAQAVETGKDFRGVLFPYQREGLQWLKFLDEGGFGGLLADEMGLGKTVQILAFFSLLEVQSPCLVVVPTSLLFNWQREIEKFLPSLQVYRHEGKERLRSKEELEQKQIILTSYALLRIDAEVLQNIDYQVVVLDEAQAIKNPDSQTAQICCRLRARNRLAITGTPIENRLEDLWSIFRFLEPDLLGHRHQYLSEMQAAQLNAQYFARVKKKIRPFILRRKKQEVAIELPPKLEQTVFVEMTEPQRQVYDRWLQNTKQGLLKKVSLDGAASHRMEILEAILRLRQLCAHPWLVEERQEDDPQHQSAKFERLISDLQEVVQDKQKVLVYSQFTSMLRLIESAIKQQGWKYVYLDGSTKNREEVVRQFQEDPQTVIFLISLKAGGVGLNLTAADYVFLYDPWWNEAVERQAIDRAHRLGKTGTVIARRYITALSIEEKILCLKEHKTALSQHLLEWEEGFGQTSIEDLLSLLTE